jgi:hypothetical protein
MPAPSKISYLKQSQSASTELVGQALDDHCESTQHAPAASFHGDSDSSHSFHHGDSDSAGDSSRYEPDWSDTQSDASSPRGLSEQQLAALPLRSTEAKDADKACAVCLADLELHEQVQELPCKHIYHQGARGHARPLRDDRAARCPYSDARVANQTDSGFGWEREGSSHGRFATPADFPPQECSPYRGRHARRDSWGGVSRSRVISLSPRAQTLYRPIRSFLSHR